MSSATSGDRVDFGEVDQLGLVHTGTADAFTVAMFRRDIGNWLSRNLELDEDRAADIVLATDEALSNSADHAYRAEERVGSMTLKVAYSPVTTELKVCVSDYGQWIEPKPTAINAVRGRGILLMRTVADDCSIDGRRDGTSVCMRFDHCPPNSYVLSQAS